MVLSCKSPSLAGLLGPSASRHLALLTRQLLNCLADHRLLQTQGSLLALGLLTLELERCCPDWLALTVDLLRKAQVRNGCCWESIAGVQSGYVGKRQLGFVPQSEELIMLMAV